MTDHTTQILPGLAEYIQLPWYDDDYDTWQLMLFDVDKDGTIYQGDTDGNWDDVTDSLPSPEEIEQAWDGYVKWVVETGKDPLNEFTHCEQMKKIEKWRFRLADSLLGIMVIRAWHNHHPAYYLGKFGDLPEHVIDYLNLKKDGANRYILSDFDHIPSLKAVVGNEVEKHDKIFDIGGKVTLHCEIEKRSVRESTPSEIRQAAKAALKGKP